MRIRRRLQDSLVTPKSESTKLGLAHTSKYQWVAYVLRVLAGLVLCIGSPYLAADTDTMKSAESTVGFEIKASKNISLCNEMRTVFNQNIDRFTAEKIDEVPIFLKWSNAQKIDEQTKKSVEADAIQELWIDLNNDQTVDHVYKTRLSLRGARGEVLYILTPHKESIALDRGISIADLLDYSSSSFQTNFQNWKALYQLTGRKDPKEIEKWQMNPNVVQYPFLFSSKTFVAAYNVFAPPNIEANLYVFSVQVNQGHHKIESECLFKRTPVHN